MPRNLCHLSHALPSEVLDTILRFLSHRPNYILPQSHVDPADVLTLVDVSDELRDAVQRHFITVSTQLESRYCDDAILDLSPEQPGLRLEDNTLLEPILLKLGPGIRCLTVSDVAGTDLRWVSALISNATTIVDLSLHHVESDFPLDNVLAACTKLRKLSLHFESTAAMQQINSVVNHASGVHSLHLDGVDPTGGFGDIWYQFTELTELALKAENLPTLAGSQNDLYANVGHTESKINTLSLGEVDEHRLIAATALCENLGERLEKLSLDVESSISAPIVAQNLRRVKIACPKVAVTLTCRADHFLPSILELQDSLEAIQPTKSPFLNTPSTLRDAAAVCTRLQSITLCLCVTLAHTFLDQLLAYVGPELLELRLNVYPQLPPDSLAEEHPRYLDVLAQHTGKLERLVIHGVQPKMSLRRLAGMNPELLGVVILVDSKMYSIVADEPLVVEQWLVGLVDGFLHSCPKLMDIVIEEHEEHETIIPKSIRIPGLDSICGKQRAGRKVGVRVGDVFYERPNDSKSSEIEVCGEAENVAR